MTEDHDLRILGRLAAAQQHQPAEDLDHEQVEQAEGHKPRSCRNRFHPAKSQVTVPVASSESVQAPAAGSCAAGRSAVAVLPVSHQVGGGLELHGQRRAPVQDGFGAGQERFWLMMEASGRDVVLALAPG